MQNESRKIVNSLHHTFDGTPWHGKSLMEILNDVDDNTSTRSMNGSMSIVNLVQHITAWRRYVIEKLKGNDAFEMHVEDNFKEKILPWHEAVKALHETQEQLIQLLNHIPDSKLKEKVPGRAFKFYVMLHGLIHHDVYHAGQIAQLYKLIQEKPQ